MYPYRKSSSTWSSCMRYLYVDCQVKVIGERQSNVPCLKDMELGNPCSSSVFMSVNLDRWASSPDMCLFACYVSWNRWKDFFLEFSSFLKVHDSIYARLFIFCSVSTYAPSVPIPLKDCSVVHRNDYFHFLHCHIWSLTLSSPDTVLCMSSTFNVHSNPI